MSVFFPNPTLVGGLNTKMPLPPFQSTPGTKYKSFVLVQQRRMQLGVHRKRRQSLIPGAGKGARNVLRLYPCSAAWGLHVAHSQGPTCPLSPQWIGGPGEGESVAQCSSKEGMLLWRAGSQRGETAPSVATIMEPGSHSPGGNILDSEPPP